MKLSFKNLALAGAALAAVTATTPKALAQPTTTLTVDPAKNWIGYTNIFQTPANGGGYVGGGATATTNLRGFFVNTQINTNNFLTLTPNTNWYVPGDLNLVNADGSANKSIDSSFYVQDDTLAGQALYFNGTCTTNTLTGDYTMTAFIKDFVQDYSGNTPSTVTLTPGQPFSVFISPGANETGHHIQYGFEMIGPSVSPAGLAAAGEVNVAVSSADPTLSAVNSQALVQGQTAKFTVTATGTAPFTYQWVYIDSSQTMTTLNDGGRISGSTSNVLTISNVVPADAGTYQVTVFNGLGTTAQAGGTLAVSPLGAVATNTLIDGGFENDKFSPTPNAGWVNFNGTFLASTNDTYYASSTPVLTIDGSFALQTYSTGGGTYNGVYQERPANPGDIYTASGFLLTPTSDTIAGNGQGWLEVQFQNAAGAVVGFYKSAVITSSSPTGVWIPVSPTNHLGTDFTTPLGTSPFMVAPAGTAKIHVQINNHADTGGSVYADAIDLRLREPATTATLGTNAVNINFATLYGPTYQVLYKTNLTQGTWTPLTTFMGDGTAKNISDPIGTTARYYIVNTQ